MSKIVLTWMKTPINQSIFQELYMTVLNETILFSPITHVAVVVILTGGAYPSGALGFDFLKEDHVLNQICQLQ